MKLQMSRRTLLRTSGAIGLTGLAAANATDAYSVPVPRQPAISAAAGAVLWGSSSADSVGAGEPGTVRAITLHDELTALGIPTVRHAFGGWKSPEILAIRSKSHPFKPNYFFGGANGELPGSGSIVVPTTDGIAPQTVTGPLPGTVAGERVDLQLVQLRSRKIRLMRVNPGSPIRVGASDEGYWRTTWEDLERGKIHVLWMGKNNSSDVQRVINDTRAAYDVEPDRTIVMGHWYTWFDRVGTESYSNVTSINDSYKSAYGEKYFDTMSALWDTQWWDLPEIQLLNLPENADNASRRDLGLPPLPFIAADTIHLNSYGYLVIAHALHAMMRSLGWA